jgi:DHA1 family bicyclomycin/chloramphenicol resistance-like MFS transporter
MEQALTSESRPFPMGRTEFVALIAMMMASVAFSIDAMLPALPQIGLELSPDSPENAPLIISMFLLGMGFGTFFAGPLSDAFGRKRVTLTAGVIYILGAMLVVVSQSFEMVLIGRILQGLGAAGPRIVALAIVRDRFAGRQMAQVISVVMIIFTIVPAVAPLVGSFIIDLSSWRGIFVAFIIFVMLLSIWTLTRLPETLPVDKRRPLQLSLMLDALKEMSAHRTVRLSILVQSLIAAMLFLTLMLVQQVYDVVYDRGEEFPYWFFVVAIVSGGASMLNALLVVRLGMFKMVTLALAFQIFLSGAFVLFDLGGGTYGFYFFVVWQGYIFFQAGLTLGNLNALSMEPMGHIAGMAASVIGAFSTVGAVMISAPLGMLFNGDEHLLTISVLILAVVAFGTMLWMGQTQRETEAD